MREKEDVMKKYFVLLILVVGVAVCSGCFSHHGLNALVGGTAGALIGGALAGEDGAVVGGLLGGALGYDYYNYPSPRYYDPPRRYYPPQYYNSPPPPYPRYRHRR